MRKENKCVTGKKKYKSQRSAHKAITRINGEEGRSSYPVRCFKCNSCLHWHLTSQTKEEFRTKDELKEVPSNIINKRLRKLENKNKHKVMKEFFEPMSDNDKIEVIRLHNEGELSYLEISRNLALSPDEVKQVIIDHNKYYGR